MLLDLKLLWPSAAVATELAPPALRLPIARLETTVIFLARLGATALHGARAASADVALEHSKIVDLPLARGLAVPVDFHEGG